MNYNQYAIESQGPSNWVVGGVACATTIVVAAATFVVTSGSADAYYYTAPAAVAANTRAVPIARVATQAQAFTQADTQTAEIGQIQSEATPVNMNFAHSGNQTVLIASFSAMMFAVASALAAAFGYRSETIAMASKAGVRAASKGAPAAGGQAGAGYKGSTIAGSAPTTRSGKPGYVYKLGLKNGRGNVDEYSPIYNPSEWKSDGDVYEPGVAGLALWAAGFLALLGASGFLIYYTSQL